MKTIRHGTLEYLAAESIAVPHGFTTRLGGVSAGHLSSLNLGMHRGDDPANVAENYRILGKALGFDPKTLVMGTQTHSCFVRRVDLSHCRGLDHRDYPEGDALITDDPEVTLMVFTADCTPILLHDPVTGAVGAAHAGWRGTAGEIGRKTVEAMVREFGCDPANIRAAIGPNVGFCHFETDADVPDAMRNAFGAAGSEHIRAAGEKYYVNLKALNALSLRRAGVARIEISDACTMCSPGRFWSHRVTGGQRGSQGALIRCREVHP